jgi:hypothetical protein
MKDLSGARRALHVLLQHEQTRECHYWASGAHSRTDRIAGISAAKVAAVVKTMIP